jgi:hypothetical protein
MIDQKKIIRVKKRIAREFPEFKGVEPQITEKAISPQERVFKKLSMGVPKEFRSVYSLRFRKTVTTVDHIKIERILIVTLDQEGGIIKITQSK